MKKLKNLGSFDAQSDSFYNALIKKKITFSSYLRKFRGIGCTVIYDAFMVKIFVLFLKY